MRKALRMGVGAIIASALVAVIGSLSLVGVLPRLTDHRTVVVQSGSMGDTAPVGSVIIVRPVDAADLREGDIAMLRRDEGRPVLHRVIDRRVEPGVGVLVRTKGDANDAADPGWITVEGTAHLPVRIVPKLGYLIAFAASPIGWVCTVLVPGVAMLVVWLRALWKDPAEEAVGEVAAEEPRSEDGTEEVIGEVAAV